MNTTHLLASEVVLVSLLAGCASLPPDEACRTGLDNEFKVFDENGYIMRNHRSPYFTVYLFEAEENELDGDYQSCLDNLSMAHQHSHGGVYASHGSYAKHGQNERSQTSRNRSSGPRGGGGGAGPPGD